MLLSCEGACNNSTSQQWVLGDYDLKKLDSS